MPHRLPSLFRWLVPLVCLGQASLWSGRALAQPPAGARCDDPRVTIDLTLKPAWKTAAVEACAALRDVPDTDPGVKLRVAHQADGVAVEAILADGRRAVRQVAAPGDLRLTLEALAVKPPPEQPPVPAAPAAPGAPAAAPPRPPAPLPPPLEVQVGLSLTGRASGLPAYLSVGPTLTADLCLGPWLVGVLGRWEAYQTLVSTELADFKMQTAGAGLFGGRRLVEQPGARLDLGLDLVVLAQTQSFHTTSAGDEEPEEDDDDDEGTSTERDGSAVDARVGLFVRAAIDASPLRWVVAFDAEISPFQIGGGARVDPLGPALPGWSVGLSAGLAFGAALPWRAP